MRIYGSVGDTCMMARIATFSSISYDRLGILDSAMAEMQHSFLWFKPGCDSLGLMRAYLCLSNLHLSLNHLSLADSVCGVALAKWNPNWKLTAIRNGLMTNQAIARANTGDLDGALASFRMVLILSEQENNALDYDGALTNIGVIHEMMGRPDSADHYYRTALQAARAKGNVSLMVKQFMNLGMLRNSAQDHAGAIAIFDSALVLARKAGVLEDQVKLEFELSDAYSALGDHSVANDHLHKHLTLKDSLLNINKAKILAEMQEKYESEKKAKEILGLKAENLEGELERNIYLFVGIGVVLLAGGLWSRLRFVHRSRAAIQKEKDVSEGLLLNILPEEVAAELKVKGYADAKEFGTATILFSDFKGFTELSEKLTADELIKELNICFKAFDGIMGQHHVEKIKTIGDAYMAAGGLPDTQKGSPADVLLAALDMQAFMLGYGSERKAQGRPYFTMRVGLHTGPVIAGIVGVKKFAYDIWGDTVNTASRMESSGEVGRVNISNTTYLLVKDDPRFTFVPRGMVAAKGKGEMEMWFAGRA